MDEKLNAAFWKALVLGVLRQLLAGVSASLIAGGYMNEMQIELILAGAAGLVVSLAWSIRNKQRVRDILDAALMSPSGTSYERAKEIAKE